MRHVAKVKKVNIRDILMEPLVTLVAEFGGHVDDEARARDKYNSFMMCIDELIERAEDKAFIAGWNQCVEEQPTPISEDL